MYNLIHEILRKFLVTEIFEYFLQTFFIDIDECDSDPYCGCSDRKTCANAPGFCVCICLEGYAIINGTDCVGKACANLAY